MVQKTNNREETAEIQTKIPEYNTHSYHIQSIVTNFPDLWILVMHQINEVSRSL